LTAGVISGNLSATLTLVGLLLCLLFLTLVTIVVPLWLKKRDTNENGKIYWSRLLYFCLIGTGFMLIEIGLIQRLSVFLGHPVYALGILLFTIIASAGVGSYLSEKLPINRWVYAYPVIVAATIILVQWFLPGLISTYITYSLTFKAVMSVAILFPLGIMLGFFFPVGMRLLPDRHESETAWYWGLNGVFGVLCSALAVFISIYFGISLNFYLAALCYATLSLCIYGIQQSKYKTV
jgi:hypothetical protein